MDWTGEPMSGFGPQAEIGEDGTTTGRSVFPHGEGEAQSLVADVYERLGDTYYGLLSDVDAEWFVGSGEAPVIRGGRRVYEVLAVLTLRDLPVILDTLAVLEEEAKGRGAEEAARLEERRKARRRELDRERRKRKALGEW